MTQVSRPTVDTNVQGHLDVSKPTTATAFAAVWGRLTLSKGIS
jgi:hypothetical protein